MNNLKIYTKSKTLLINELGKNTNLEFIDIKDIANTNLDVYFHSGSIDENTNKLVANSKKVIVNSNSARIEILDKTDVDRKKVFIVYPAVKAPVLKAKEAKKQLCKELACAKKTRLIFFTARNLKTNGVKELFDAILALNNDNFKVIIASNKEQIETLKFQLAKFKIIDKVVFYEDFIIKSFADRRRGCGIVKWPTKTTFSCRDIGKLINPIPTRRDNSSGPG